MSTAVVGLKLFFLKAQYYHFIPANKLLTYTANKNKYKPNNAGVKYKHNYTLISPPRHKKYTLIRINK